MGKRCLVAFDTDHIKQYVFATDKLAEIRGASSILDRLNRHDMARIAREEGFVAYPVYTNGGSGLFLLEGDKPEGERFGRSVQAAYRQQTGGGASITFAVEDIPAHIPDTVEAVRKANLKETLARLRYRLDECKDRPPAVVTLPSHPFMRTCDACGSRYAEQADDSEVNDPLSRDRRYCGVCMRKRDEDGGIKGRMSDILAERSRTGTVTRTKTRPYTWEQMLRLLPPGEYDIPPDTSRPPDFDRIPTGDGVRDYMALIYADGNGMGQMMSGLHTLDAVEQAAHRIDNAVFVALSRAIKQHLKIALNQTPHTFPFDILLIGGDDIVIVTPATRALVVACTLAKEFYKESSGRSLAVGVVLAPIKYPFGLLHDLAESTLDFAKKEAATRPRDPAYGDTMINFITVTGSTSPDFEQVYKGLHRRKVQVGTRQRAFYATRRPYTVDALAELLKRIEEGRNEGLSRSKLHQVREAVLKMNLSTSVYDGMSTLRNWKRSEREFVLHQVYPLGNPQPEQRPVQAPARFPVVTFPWYADGADTYRTGLLDYVELYDFVPRKGEA